MSEEQVSTGLESIVRLVDIGASTATVVVDGDIDVATVAPLREAFAACISAGCTSITLHMGAVSFMDSAGLAALAYTIKTLGSDGLLTLDRPSRSIRRLLDLSGMSNAVAVVPPDPSTDSP